MKAAFGVEAIGVRAGELHRHRVAGTTRLARELARPWLRELTGLDRVGQPMSVELPARRDYREANSAGTRGVWWWWTLDAGHVYETRYRASWARWLHRYLTVTEHGEIVDMTEEEVKACLRNVISG